MRRNSNWLLAACIATLSTFPSLNYHNIRKFNLTPRNNLLSFSTFTRKLLQTRLLAPSASYALAEAPPRPPISYLDAKTSKEIDDKLMSTFAFSIDQLMELAGLSVAAAVRDYTEYSSIKNKNILIICGPGNNGGDGLVAARHLVHFGFNPIIVYPKPSQSSLFANLVTQCKDLGIPIQSTLPDNLENFDLIVDGIFGFSFHGPAKPPFDNIISRLASTQVPVLSIDIPSGWHVEDGDIFNTQFMPAGVISLTAPKKCVQSYLGTHYLGGRFLPPKLANEYGLIIPSYPAAEQIVRLSPQHNVDTTGWTLQVTEEGYPYYYNPITNQSLWAKFEQPAARNEKDNISVILSTASSMEEAKSIAAHLVRKKMVACVNIVPSITSIYEWEGKIEESTEVQMIIKTRSILIPEVTKEIKLLHSYSVPEVISLDVVDGNKDYLSWVVRETTRND